MRMDDPPTEVHIVNGLHPDLPFSYYEELLRGFKRIKPDVHLKCFTAVEIHFFAQHYGMTYARCSTQLRAAGLDRLPGGGAEIFDEDVRTRISHDKATGDRVPRGARVAHRPRHDARTRRCSTATSRRSRTASITSSACARCRTRRRASRPSSRSRFTPTATG